ncbi:MAG: hypothetical protein GX774_11220, partial [Armatimonadetes bacterium]|nr:hypothetical protein [Armatimonadota bacterium]
MEATIPWVAVAASLFGLLVALLVPTLYLPPGATLPSASAAGLEHRERSAWRPLLGAGALLALALFAATLPTRPPFGTGQILGRGLLLGAAGALLGAALLRHIGARVARAAKPPADTALQLTAIAAAVGLLALGVLAVALATLLFPLSHGDAFNGVALGALLVCGLGRLIFGLRATAPRLADGAALQGWGLFIVALCVATAFGHLHFTHAQTAARQVPLGMAAVVVLALIIGAGLFGAAPSATRVFVGAGAVSAVLLGGLSVVVLPKLVPGPEALTVALLGLGTAALATFLAWAAQSYDAEDPGPFGVESAALLALLALGLFVVAFQALRGYGVGLALVAGWSIGGAALAALCWRDLMRARAAVWPHAAPDPGSEVETIALPLHRLLGVVLLAALFRLFLERYRPLATDLTLTIHFTLVGLVVGAIFPLLLGATIGRATWRRRLAPSAWSALLLGIGLAVWTVALPAAAGVAWGLRSLVGVMAGLLVAGIYGLFGVSGSRHEEGSGIARDGALLLSVGMALVMVQAAHLLGPLGMVPRTTRVAVLVALATFGLVWLVLSAWLNRRRVGVAPPTPPISGGLEDASSSPPASGGPGGAASFPPASGLS